MKLPRLALLAAVATPAGAQLGGVAYPIHFTLPGLLLQQEPGVVVEPLTLSALAAGAGALVSRYGYSWTATRYRLDGTDLTDPYQPGRPLGPVDVEALEKTALQPDGVVALQLREPSRAWHGRLASYSTESRLASDNLPPPSGRGLLQRPEQFHWLTHNHLEADGPLGRRADMFVSTTGQWASQTVPRAPPGEDLDSRALLGNARFRVNPVPRHQLEAGFSGAWTRTSGWALPAGLEALTGRRRAPPLRPHPDLEGHDGYSLVQAGWRPRAKSAFELRYAYLRAHLDTRGGEPGAPTRIELTTGGVSGSPPLANRALRTRHSFQAALQPAAPRLFARDHQFTLAAEWQAAGMRNRYTAPGGVHAVTAEGEPAFVVELNTPARSHSRVQTLSLALEDRLALTGWLAVEAGIRLDSARGAEPASLSWHHLAPRVGLALTLARLALRGGYARAYAPLAGRYLDFASPDSLSGLEYRWVDANGDRRFQPRERGELLRRFGGAYSSISSRLRRPFADEFTVSAEVSLPARSFARVGAFRREDKYRLGVVNPPVFLSYLPPRIIQDPGPDFINGTFDDQQVLVWEQDPATFGADRFLLRSTPALRTLSEGVLLEAGAGHSGFQCRASFLAAKSTGQNNAGNEAWENDPGVAGSLFQDPNTLLYAYGRSFFDRAYTGRFLASWRAPRKLGGFESGSVVTYLDGLAFGRRLLVKDLAQGPMLIAATVRGSPEGGHRTQYYLSWDLRLSRRFGALQAYADVFNVLNRGSRLREDDLSGPRFNQRLPLALQPARFLRLGLAYSF